MASESKQWSGLPVFACRWCTFERVNDRPAVEEHERLEHRDLALAHLFNPPPVPPTREEIERETWVEAATLVRNLVEAGKTADEVLTVFAGITAIGEVPDLDAPADAESDAEVEAVGEVEDQ